MPVAANPMITIVANSPGAKTQRSRQRRTSALAKNITTKQKPALVGKYDQVISEDRTIQIEKGAPVTTATTTVIPKIAERKVIFLPMYTKDSHDRTSASLCLITFYYLLLNKRSKLV